MKKILTIVCLLFVAYAADAQYYTYSYTRGRLYSPAGWSKDIIRPTYGCDVTISWPVEQEGRLPYFFGLRYNFAYIPQGIAGNRFGLSAFLTTKLASVDPLFFRKVLMRGDLSAQIGGGFGLYTKPKMFTHDPNNEYIAINPNCVFDIGLVYTQPFDNGGALVLGAKFVHNSNGFLALPNKGLNYIQAEFGWREVIPQEDYERRTKPLKFNNDEHSARTSFFLMGAGGLCVPGGGENGHFFPAYVVQLGWRMAYQPYRAFGFGVDLGYNFADNLWKIRNGEKLPFPVLPGLFAFHETFWGPISLKMGIGYYVYTPKSSPIYERVGVFYHFFDKSNQSVGLSIKANLGRADFIELSYCIDLW